jgi:hypothetical protein
VNTRRRFVCKAIPAPTFCEYWPGEIVDSSPNSRTGRTAERGRRRMGKIELTAREGLGVWVAWHKAKIQYTAEHEHKHVHTGDVCFGSER